MELDTRSFGDDWANDAFVALNNSDLQPAEKWAAFTNAQFPQSAFTIPPTLLTHGSVARYGQVTPPEELSPASAAAEPPHNGDGDSDGDGHGGDDARERSIPFADHQIQALQNFQLPDHQEQDRQEDPERAPKRRRTSRQPSAANQTASQPQQDSAPPKRKRGRPKSQPQMVEAFTADGFPFQVSSARQSHLEKNRVAAHKCRQRKKEYIGGLEGRAREFTATNKALKENVAMLREELLELKNEVLRHAGCGFWAVDEYLTRCAGDLLGMQVPAQHQQQQPPSSTFAPNDQDQSQMQSHRQSSATQVDTDCPSMTTLEPDSPDHDDYGGFDLLEDMDEDNEGLGA
ncbi:hypothetical protein P280DRAFT_473104 [Massarina eburnea CBS 473.64]|uniref:BZIP domain-containing protein n=1 Tax=Massarina eburnea CBS 473.64 TaxID=1395130 RepID=A0A6A6RLM0_9PLEO|nr:hypothetical protein P280DRAFT_473104 [Massarina eburnea CBS 473.64]